jgi:hypothetical protein
MNQTILELWKETSVINFNSKIYNKVLKFVKYFDKHSMWLVEFNNVNQSFLFSNDGQRLTFTLNQILKHIENIEAGIPFPWNKFTDM